jgi:hypothetical protein
LAGILSFVMGCRDVIWDALDIMRRVYVLRD